MIVLLRLPVFEAVQSGSAHFTLALQEPRPSEQRGCSHWDGESEEFHEESSKEQTAGGGMQ